MIHRFWHNVEEEAKEEQNRLDNLFFSFYFFRKKLRMHQFSAAAANGFTASGVFVGIGYRTRRQRRFLLLLLLSVLFFSVTFTFTFGFWTFQSDESIFAPPYYKLEKFASTTAEGTKERNGKDEGISAETAKTNRDGNATEIVPNVTSTFAVPPRHSVADLPACADYPPGLIGPIPVWMDAPGFETLNKLYPRVRQGGHNWPDKCTARHRVAIIIPYRNREAHLRIFLHNLHFLLSKQQMDYAIFVVEQTNNQTFNRAKLMNVGFVEASRLYDWQCFVFHDVDLLPEDDRNLYSCPEHPRHMSVAVDKFDYALPYAHIFGGVTAMTRKQFERVNGYSNDYWGWGGEDDDISYRLAYAGLKISRYPATIARYKMVKHEHDGGNPSNNCRWQLLDKTRERWRQDGLSNLKYTLLATTFHRVYTNFVVDLLEDDSRRGTFASRACRSVLLSGAMPTTAIGTASAKLMVAIIGNAVLLLTMRGHHNGGKKG
ncbi:hypothetical protein niasHT_025846 [Heterodera trifolii]|uniref:Beta-1,4-N-acetylgalactosaminyltransferase n=1 Tax=Heterodera trifolii TaxID=157864 RepID=A0ABD2KJJ5_9BILA